MRTKKKKKKSRKPEATRVGLYYYCHQAAHRERQRHGMVGLWLSRIFVRDPCLSIVVVDPIIDHSWPQDKHVGFLGAGKFWPPASPPLAVTTN